MSWGALVPFNSAGPAADQSADERLLQFGNGVVLRLRQEPARAGAARNGAGGGSAPAAMPLSDGADSSVEWPQDEEGAGAGPTSQTRLANVGLVVWQSGYVLAELLLRHPPLGPWQAGIHVLDLGSGTGVVGLALCMAGARVTLTDLPHITPLTRTNVTANCSHTSGPLTPRVLEYEWGSPVGELLAKAGGRPDIITAADVLYEPTARPALLASLRALAAPHTLIYVAYRTRNVSEEAFAGEAEAAGFAVDVVPETALAPEYHGGQYMVMRLAVREAMDVDMSGAEAVGQGMHVGGLGLGGQGGDEGDEEDIEDIEHKPCVQS